jgi:putative tryptophan/tyrosine transport system substrate-binding protein
VLVPGTSSAERHRLAALVQRLGELGWAEGRTLIVVPRWAEGRGERYAEIAAEFVRMNVDVIITGGTPAAVAAMHATSLIPIIFVAVGDPVATGLVASLARPGGNVTGLSNQGPEIAGKRLAFLRDVVRICADWQSWPIPVTPVACWRSETFKLRPTLSAWK